MSPPQRIRPPVLFVCAISSQERFVAAHPGRSQAVECVAAAKLLAAYGVGQCAAPNAARCSPDQGCRQLVDPAARMPDVERQMNALAGAVDVRDQTIEESIAAGQQLQRIAGPL